MFGLRINCLGKHEGFDSIMLSGKSENTRRTRWKPGGNGGYKECHMCQHDWHKYISDISKIMSLMSFVLKIWDKKFHLKKIKFDNWYSIIENFSRAAKRQTHNDRSKKILFSQKICLVVEKVLEKIQKLVPCFVIKFKWNLLRSIEQTLLLIIPKLRFFFLAIKPIYEFINNKSLLKFACLRVNFNKT